MSASSVPARSPHRWWPLLLPSTAIAATIAWMMVALAVGRQSGWMAVVAALAVTQALRLGGWRGGASRIALALLTTALVVIAANWSIASAQIGGAMGFPLWSALARMGAHYAWTLSWLANTPADMVWMAVAAGVAVLAAR